METNKTDLAAMLAEWPGKKPDGMRTIYELRLLMRSQTADSRVTLASVRMAGGEWKYISALKADAEERAIDVTHPIARIIDHVRLLNNEFDEVEVLFQIHAV